MYRWWYFWGRQSNDYFVFVIECKYDCESEQEVSSSSDDSHDDDYYDYYTGQNK